MTSVKQECEDAMVCNDDNWLSYWANSEKVVKVENIKPTNMKSELLQEESINKRNLIGKGDKLENRKRKVKKDCLTTNACYRIKYRQDAGKITEGEKENVKIKNLEIKASKKLQQSFESALKNAETTDKIANLCEYKCPKCNFTTSVRNTLYSHINRNKHESSEDQSGFNKYLTRIVAHECNVCSRKVLCERAFILRHIKYCHKILSLSKYVHQDYHNFVKKPTTMQMELKSFFAKNVTQDNTTKIVGNLCTFICQTCDYICQSWGGLKKHIKKQNHGPLLSITKHVKNPWFHKCDLCNEVLFCDVSILYLHQFQKHQSSLKHYKKVIMVSNNYNLPLEYREKIKSIIQVTPSEKNLPHILKPGSLPPNQVTNDVGNLCFFNCSHCSKSNLSFGCLRTHCKHKHRSKPVSLNLEQAVEVRYHRCQLCNKIIACDNNFIRSHVNNAHKISFVHYVNEYVLKRGNRAIPTFRQYQINKQVLEQCKNNNQAPKSQCARESDLIEPSMLSSESEDSD